MRSLLSLIGLAALHFSLAQGILLPSGRGPYNVTIRTSQLSDFSRREVFSAEPGYRRLMILVFSPIIEDVSACKSPYMPPDVAAYLTAVYSSSPPPLNFTIDFSSLFLPACSLDVTHSVPDHQQGRNASSFPVIIFGPGLGFSRLVYSVISQFLASYGFIVVTVDHPYDAVAVQFPDGSAALFSPETQDSDDHLQRDLHIRATDVSFVLDQLGSQTLYPAGVRPSSLDSVGIWGHSFGGATVITALMRDKRFKGGINVDGTVYGSDGVLDAPLILWQAEGETDPSWTDLWPRARGFKRHLGMRGAKHRGLTDLKLIADLVGVSSAQFGTVDGLREVDVMTRYVRDFFAYVLQGKGLGLVHGPSEEFPEVEFLR